MGELETEVKFYLSQPAKLISRLTDLNAELVQPRVLEINLRFDTPGMTLSNQARVLRLRQDEAIHLTYKGPGQITQGVLSRQEIEFTVSDFTAAKHFLEALGYEVIVSYEKYRQTYQPAEVLITVDEMPYGHFAEIEGLDPGQIRHVAELLQLNWNNRIIGSYLDIFRMLKSKMKLDFKDLNFENFQGLEIKPIDLNISPAD